jgi:large subunit ribosomal protein L1
MPRSKRYLEIKKLIDKNKTYAPKEAIELAKKTANTRFDASIEVHCRLGIDPKKGEQQVRAVVVMPNPVGKAKKIAAIVTDKDQKATKDAGADLVGGKELIEEIKKTGKINFDIAIATPEMMKDLAQIAKILGPKGLMPSPKNETVTTNIAKTISEIKKGKVSFKNDDTANVHQVIGNVSLPTEKLLENFEAFMAALRRAKPASSKGIFIKSVVIASTMGPGIKVQV